MENTPEREQVHIIPLGYEFDRAIRPFDDGRISRAHLITMADMEKYSSPDEITLTKGQRKYDMMVADYIRAKGADVIIHQTDMFDILSFMTLMTSIIEEEKNIGADISVNMSACGRLTAFATTLAAMAHQVRLYYVRADSYSDNKDETEKHGLSICSSSRIWNLENFHFDLPHGIDRMILIMIPNTEDGISEDTIVKNLIVNEVEGYPVRFWDLPVQKRRLYQSNYLMKINKGPIRRLTESGYIIKEKKGRQTFLTLSPSGKYVASVCGQDQSRNLKPGDIS